MTYQTRTTLHDVWCAQYNLVRTLDRSGLLNHPTYGRVSTVYSEGRPRWHQSFSLTFTRYLTDDEVKAYEDANNGSVPRSAYRHTEGQWTGTTLHTRYCVEVPAAEIHPALAGLSDLTQSRGEARRRLMAADDKVKNDVAARTEGAVEALNTVAGLLLDQVGVVTYETMVADGMDRAEALRTAILLSRMEG